jgi:hypothetical protein
MAASAGETFALRSVEATTGFDQDGARITVTPRFNVETEDKDVEVNCSNDKTTGKLTVSVDSQEVTISEQVDDDNSISPTINSNGYLSVDFDRRLSDDSFFSCICQTSGDRLIFLCCIAFLFFAIRFAFKCLENNKRQQVGLNADWSCC